jgi:hypothetical protein
MHKFEIETVDRKQLGTMEFAPARLAERLDHPHRQRDV